MLRVPLRVVRAADAGTRAPVLRSSINGSEGLQGHGRQQARARAWMPIQAESRLIDYDAERIVIAGLMRAPDLNVNRVRSIVNKSDFSWMHHQWLYGKCLELWYSHRHVPVRLDLIASEVLELRGSRLNRWDFGPDPCRCLLDIYQSDPTGIWCLGNAKQVRELAERRRVVQAARIRIRDAINGVLV